MNLLSSILIFLLCRPVAPSALYVLFSVTLIALRHMNFECSHVSLLFLMPAVFIRASLIQRKWAISSNRSRAIPRAGAGAGLAPIITENEPLNNETIELLTSIKANLDNVPDDIPKQSIHRVPMLLRQMNEAAYTPTLVSIGPLNIQICGGMQAHKLRYLKEFLNRDKQKTMEFYVQSLTRLEETARQCYSEPLDSVTTAKFLEIMLIDGCFIIQLMLKSTGKENFHPNDPICNASWMDSVLRMDLLLLENQLPFFVIEHLFNLINDPVDKHWSSLSFLDLTLDYFSDFLLDTENAVKNPRCQIEHFTDLLRKCNVPSSPQSISVESGERPKLIPSATELHGSGVKFQMVDNKCFWDIKFTKSGVLSIPRLVVEDGTEIIFRNVIAFEHFDTDPSYVSDYIKFMDCLIDTTTDVALLRKSGIIDSWLGDNEEVSLLFNKMGKGMYTDPDTFYYASLFKEVNDYYKKPWHEWRAKMTRDYFDSPWSTISFIAAVVLLVATIIQTVFTVISR